MDIEGGKITSAFVYYIIKYLPLSRIRRLLLFFLQNLTCSAHIEWKRSCGFIYHLMNQHCFILWQIASACWELFCLEHGIQPDGTMCQENNLDNDSNAFFSSRYCHSTRLLKCAPRVVLIDSEPIPIDEIRTGCYRSLFDPYTLITGREDASSNYGRGYNTLGYELIDMTLESVRRVAECCECLQGFISFRSMGGGTGSGLGTLIQENIADEFSKSCRHEFDIFLSPK